MSSGQPPSAISRETRRKPRLYYGWVIVGVIFLTSLAATVQLNPTISVFVKPITEEFGWSRSALAGALTIGTIMGGILAAAVGPLVDRFGGRWVLVGGFLLLGGLLISLSFIHALWHFYAIAITTRMLIQGVIGITNNVAVAKWFVRQRGRAVGLASLGQRFGNGVTPYFAQAFIGAHGWRTAIVAVGLYAWGLTLIPVMGWLRRQPEDMGLRADGAPPERAGADSARTVARTVSAHRPEVSFTLREALRAPVFYVLLVSAAFSVFAGAGINFNMQPLFTDRGLSASQGALVIAIWSLIGIPASVIAGFLAERLAGRHMLALIYLGVAGGIVLLTQVNSVNSALLFAVVHGSFFGGMVLLQNLIYADYFGRRSLGSIRGFTTPFQMAANSLGPLAGALVYDLTGGYTPILVVFTALMAVSALAMVVARPPARPEGARNGAPIAGAR